MSTDEQNPDHQLDALHRAGVSPDDVYLDRASGAKASRPQLDLLLRHLRNGDTLVITRLDRDSRGPPAGPRRVGRAAVHRADAP